MKLIKRFFSTLPGCFQMALDVALYNAALIGAFYIRYSGAPPERNFFAYMDITTWVVGMPIVAFYLSGLYSIKWREAAIQDFMRVVRAVFYASIGVLMVVYFFRGRENINAFPTLVFIYSFVLGVFFLSGWRYFLRSMSRHYEIRRGVSLNVILVGVEGMSPEILRNIKDNDTPIFTIHGFLHDTEKLPDGLDDVPSLGKRKDLEKVLGERKIDEVIFAAEGITYRELFDGVQTCEKLGVHYRVLPTFLDMMTATSRVDLINYIPVIRYGSSRIEGWNALFKYVLDKAVALVLLPIVIPITIIVSIAIRLETKGSPIFVQKRVGKDGRLFNMYKFRTMRAGAEAQGALTEDNDPRITRVGKFLRKTSLDELPQIYNVLFGQMSLVGPRAVVPYVADKFSDMERESLNVLPGITGLAQVSGRDELGFRGKSLLNIYYIRNYSPLLDLKILLKTVDVVLRREGTEGTKQNWES